MDKTARIRVLLVGCGRMGRNHLRVLREMPEDFEVVGIVDPVRPPADIEGGADWFRQIPHDGFACDAAVIATPADRHPQDAFYLRHVSMLIEKPIALSNDFAENFSGYRAVVGHIERFNPVVRELKRRVDSGEVEGDIGTRRVGGPRPADSRNIVLDLAVHDIDLLRWIWGPMRVEYSTAEPDYIYACLRGQNLPDTGITVTCNWTAAAKQRVIRVGGNVFDLMDHSANPLRAELTAFAHFVRTGERGDLCSAEDGAKAVRLCEDALNPREYV